MTQNDLQVKKNRAVLVGLWAHRLSVEENATEETMEELADLLETAGGECVGTVLQSRTAPTPAPLSARARWRRSGSWSGRWTRIW